MVSIDGVFDRLLDDEVTVSLDGAADGGLLDTTDKAALLRRDSDGPGTAVLLDADTD